MTGGADARLRGIQKVKGGGPVHLAVGGPAERSVTTLCSIRFEVGRYRWTDEESDCRTCMRRRDDPAQVSSAFFREDAGADFLALAVERSRLAREARPNPASAPRPPVMAERAAPRLHVVPPPPAPKVKGTPVLIISGTIGAGKSTIALEVSRILGERGDLHALIDLDHLGTMVPAPAQDLRNVELTMHNLAAIWPNYRAAGVRRAVIASVVQSRDDLAQFRRAIPNAALAVVELRAAPESLLAGAADHVVATDGRPVRAVAEEVLRLAGWD